MMRKLPWDSHRELAARPVPPDTKYIRKSRRFAVQDFPVCTLPGRRAEAIACRSRGTVRSRPRQAPRRGGVLRRACKHPELPRELARRFFRANKYRLAFCGLLRARDFQFPCVPPRCFVRTGAVRLPTPSHFFRLLLRTSSVRVERLPVFPFPLRRWRFRAAGLCRLRWFLPPRFVSGISLRVRAIRKLQIRFSCA